MIEGLGRFVEQLRREGVRVSPAEWLEAMRAAELIGVADRRRFRQALGCTLIKHRDQRAAFDRAFDRFFAAPRGLRGDVKRGGEGAGRAARERGAASGGPPTTVRPVERRSPSAVPARRSTSVGPETPRKALERLVEQARTGPAGRSGRLRRVDRGPARAAGEAERPATTRGEAIPVERRPLRGRIDPDEERVLAAALPRLVRRLRLGSARRRRRASRGRLYLRALFRDNLRHGGIPWTLPRRRPRRRRVRVVLLVDVSWSTARASGLFLAMAAEFLTRARRTRVLFFVDRAVDAGWAVEDWLERGARVAPPASRVNGARRRPGAGVVRRGVPFDALVGGLRGLNTDAPSDYGRTFHGLLRSPWRPAGRNTLLLVLGDGRTNRLDTQAWAFEEIADRCGAVIWLVPEPFAEWGSGDSALDAYLPWVDSVVEARDLAGLARGVAELARRL